MRVPSIAFLAATISTKRRAVLDAHAVDVEGVDGDVADADDEILLDDFARGEREGLGRPRRRRARRSASARRPAGKRSRGRSRWSIEPSGRSKVTAALPSGSAPSAGRGRTTTVPALRTNSGFGASPSAMVTGWLVEASPMRADDDVVAGVEIDADAAAILGAHLFARDAVAVGEVDLPDHVGIGRQRVVAFRHDRGRHEVELGGAARAAAVRAR